MAGLSSIVRKRNQITAEFLAYLAELDERQLFLDLGFASLFEYCVEALGLCESTAGRHIAAARVCRNHPEVFALVASGELHASALSLLRKHLTTENAVFRGLMCAIWCVACRRRRGGLSTLSVSRRRCQRRSLHASRRSSNRKHSSRLRRVNHRPHSGWRRRSHADSNPCPRIATACIRRAFHGR